MIRSYTEKIPLPPGHHCKWPSVISKYHLVNKGDFYTLIGGTLNIQTINTHTMSFLYYEHCFFYFDFVRVRRSTKKMTHYIFVFFMFSTAALKIIRKKDGVM